MSSPNIRTEVGQLRTRLQADSLLRLEVLGALARVFRENGVKISGELLHALVLALPEEMIGTGTPQAETRRGITAIIPPQPGGITAIIPPQPGGLTAIIPPQPGGESEAAVQARGLEVIPPQPGSREETSARKPARKPAKKSAKKSSKKSRK